MDTFTFSSNVPNICVRSSDHVGPTSTIIPPMTPLFELNTDLNFASSTLGYHSYIEMQKALPNQIQMDSSQNYILRDIKQEPSQIIESPTTKMFRTNKELKAISSTVSMVKLEAISPNFCEIQKCHQIDSSYSTPINISVQRNKSESPIFIPISQPHRDIGHYMGLQVADIGGLTQIHCDNIFYQTSELLPNINFEDVNKIRSAGKDSLRYCQYSNQFSPHSILWPNMLTQNSQCSSQNIVIPTFHEQTRLQCEPEPVTTQLHLLGSNFYTISPSNSIPICQHSQLNTNILNPFLSDSKKTFESQMYINVNIENSDERSIPVKNNVKSNVASTTGFHKDRLENEISHKSIRADSSIISSFSKLATPKCYGTLTNICDRNLELMESADQLQQISERKINGGIKTCFKTSNSKMVEMRDVNIQTDVPSYSEIDNSNTELYCDIPEVESNNSRTRLISVQDQKQEALNIVLHKTSLEPKGENSVINQTDNSNYISYGFSPRNDCIPNLISDNINILYTLPTHLEMSGLELLSNISTASFGEHEPVLMNKDRFDCNNKDSTKNGWQNNEMCGKNNLEPSMRNINCMEKNEVVNCCPSVSQNNRPVLGGLNLLCALAEQRIQEEVEGRTITTEENFELGSKRHKHSKSKYNRSRCLKKMKKRNSKDRKKYIKSLSEGLILNDKKKKGPNSNEKDHDSMLNKCPYSNNIFKALETDMRTRLVDITRKYKKKKRQLDQISSKKKYKKMSSEYKIASISCKNPNFICFLDKCQSKSYNFSHSIKDTQKSAKNIDCHAFMETNHYRKETSGKISDNTNINTEFFQNTTFCSYNKNNKIKLNQKRDVEKNEVVTTLFTHKRPRESLEFENRENILTQVDKKLVLTNDHLYQKETRVLTDMGGLFYAGVLKPLQPPDVYAITLDGERGNKSHIMSREDIFKDTILEIVPRDIKSIPVGTRLCAYWSQQYRCLYPGKALETAVEDFNLSFVSVEFDDGDSGKIHLQNIRFLLSDYPIVEYNEGPLNYLLNNKFAAKKSLSVNIVSHEHKSKDVCQKMTGDRCSLNIDNTFKMKRRTCTDYVQKKTKSDEKSHQNPIELVCTSDKCLHSPKQSQKERFNEQSQLSFNQFGCTELKTKKHAKEAKSKAGNKDRLKKNDVCTRGSKIAAFLPERQLWSWHGQAYRKTGTKGRMKKYFYKTIIRGNERISVGECAVFLSTGRPDRPYIGRIEAMWENMTCNKIVRVRWFYHPEETIGCPELKYPGALFVSSHEDENDVQTVSHKCEVKEFSIYIAKFGLDEKQYQSIYENNDTFYLSGFYNPRMQTLTLQSDIPTKSPYIF